MPGEAESEELFKSIFVKYTLNFLLAAVSTAARQVARAAAAEL